MSRFSSTASDPSYADLADSDSKPTVDSSREPPSLSADKRPSDSTPPAPDATEFSPVASGSDTGSGLPDLTEPEDSPNGIAAPSLNLPGSGGASNTAGGTTSPGVYPQSAISQAGGADNFNSMPQPAAPNNASSTTNSSASNDFASLEAALASLSADANGAASPGAATSPYVGLSSPTLPAPTSNNVAQPASVAIKSATFGLIPPSSAQTSQSAQSESTANAAAATVNVPAAFQELPSSLNSMSGAAFVTQGFDGYQAEIAANQLTLSLSQNGAESTGAALPMTFVGANSSSQVQVDPQITADVNYPNIWPGISISYQAASSSHRQLEYSYILAPGADVSQIQTQFPSATRLSIDSQGGLVISPGDGQNFIESAPIVTQVVNSATVNVSGKYVLLGNNSVGMSLGAYKNWCFGLCSG